MQFRHMYTPLHPWHQSVPSKGAFIALLHFSSVIVTMCHQLYMPLRGQQAELPYSMQQSTSLDVKIHAASCIESIVDTVLLYCIPVECWRSSYKQS
eukprot:14451-Heterococcus_DN1.PRE.1